MGLQAGILHRQSLEVCDQDLAILLGGRGCQNSEVSGATALGPLLMAYRGFRTTPEDESQPLMHNSYILTWDGRLDNREEIAARAGLNHTEVLSDASIILSAYSSLDNEVLADLVGEFALCLWCERTRSLCFARSICGTRPLYYVLLKDRLVWSTDFEHLVSISHVDLDVNDSYLLEYLVTQPSSRHTPLSRINTVPPGAVLSFQNDAFLSERSLWNPKNINLIHYGSNAQYEEHCRHLLSEAVRVRLRTRDPLFAELSGGLDSSAVVLLADQHLRAANRPTADLKTLSCVYDESATGDERIFIQSVEETRGSAGHHVQENEQQITIALSNVTFTGVPNPLHCFPGRYRAFSKLMRAHKARVLLTGLGGDHLFWSEPDGALVIADELEHKHFLQATRECRIWSRLLGIPYLALFSRILMVTILSGHSSNEPSFGSPEIPPWLCQRHREEIRSKVWEFKTPQESLDTISRTAQLRMVRSLFALVSAGYFNEFREICLSHPYVHRPLLEFCLGVPISQFLYQGQTRSLMRRALRDLLPAKVLNRKSKGMLDEAFVRALRREWSNIGDLDRWQLCERGFADGNTLHESLDRLRLGLPARGASAIRIFSIERWLRSLGTVSSVQKPNDLLPNELMTVTRHSTSSGQFVRGATLL